MQRSAALENSISAAGMRRRAHTAQTNCAHLLLHLPLARSGHRAARSFCVNYAIIIVITAAAAASVTAAAARELGPSRAVRRDAHHRYFRVCVCVHVHLGGVHTLKRCASLCRRRSRPHCIAINNFPNNRRLALSWRRGEGEPRVTSQLHVRMRAQRVLQTCMCQDKVASKSLLRTQHRPIEHVYILIEFVAWRDEPRSGQLICCGPATDRTVRRW